MYDKDDSGFRFFKDRFFFLFFLSTRQCVYFCKLLFGSRELTRHFIRLRVKYAFVYQIFFHVCILITAHFSFDCEDNFLPHCKNSTGFYIPPVVWGGRGKRRIGSL